MTKIEFGKRNDMFTAVDCKGHSGYADRGYDIICSAVSALVQSTFIGLKKVQNLEVEFAKNEKNAQFGIKIGSKSIIDAQVLMKTLFLSLKDIEIGNEKYLKVEVYDEVY